MDRRSFLAGMPLAVAGIMHAPSVLRASSRALPSAMRPHPFVDAHPEAVFIRRTQVADKLDAVAKRAEGLAFAREYFAASESDGIPFTDALTIKPNLTCTFGTGASPEGMGIITDISFLDGLFAGIRETGFPGFNMYAREGNWMSNGYCSSEYQVTGVPMNAVAQAHGMHLFDFATGRLIYNVSVESMQSGTEVVWKDIPDGVVFKRVGYLAPFHDEHTWLLNVAKFKTHGMGVTLCAKNMQGTAVSPYVRFCEGLDSTAQHPQSILKDFHADREQRVQERYQAHLAAGVPRWDRPGRDASGGFSMETWAQRTCDSLSIRRDGLHMVEGIYGRNGNGFTAGPGQNNTPQEFMSNLLIFGKNPFLVDVIGTWLAGHEPGNFGLYHIARERGMCHSFNPADIAVYEWNSGTPILARLEDMSRTPLLCPYLRKDYDGGSEAEYHMVDEPFDYGAVPTTPLVSPSECTVRALINPVRDSALFEYTLPAAGRAAIAIFSVTGTCVWRGGENWHEAGAHALRWQRGTLPAGMYIVRLHSRSGHAHARVVLL